MPSPEKMPLAHRIGPERAGAAKTVAHHYYVEKGWTPREIAAYLQSSLGITVTASTVHVWARNAHWIQGEHPEKKKRVKPSTSERAKVEAAKACKKRCPMCMQVVLAGEAHVCQAKATEAVPVPKLFAGSFL